MSRGARDYMQGYNTGWAEAYEDGQGAWGVVEFLLAAREPAVELGLPVSVREELTAWLKQDEP